MHHSHMRVIYPTLILCAISLSVPDSAHAASFDCNKARATDERAVCASRSLSEMDVEMAVRFEMLAGLVPVRVATWAMRSGNSCASAHAVAPATIASPRFTGRGLSGSKPSI